MAKIETVEKGMNAACAKYSSPCTCAIGGDRAEGRVYRRNYAGYHGMGSRFLVFDGGLLSGGPAYYYLEERRIKIAGRPRRPIRTLFQIENSKPKIEPAIFESVPLCTPKT